MEGIGGYSLMRSDGTRWRKRDRVQALESLVWGCWVENNNFSLGAGWTRLDWARDFKRSIYRRRSNPPWWFFMVSDRYFYKATCGQIRKVHFLLYRFRFVVLGWVFSGVRSWLWSTLGCIILWCNCWRAQRAGSEWGWRDTLIIGWVWWRVWSGGQLLLATQSGYDPACCVWSSLKRSMVHFRCERATF